MIFKQVLDVRAPHIHRKAQTIINWVREILLYYIYKSIINHFPPWQHTYSCFRLDLIQFVYSLRSWFANSLLKSTRNDMKSRFIKNNLNRSAIYLGSIKHHKTTLKTIVLWPWYQTWIQKHSRLLQDLDLKGIQQ